MAFKRKNGPQGLRDWIDIPDSIRGKVTTRTAQILRDKDANLFLACLSTYPECDAIGLDALGIGLSQWPQAKTCMDSYAGIRVRLGVQGTGLFGTVSLVEKLDAMAGRTNLGFTDVGEERPPSAPDVSQTHSGDGFLAATRTLSAVSILCGAQ